VGNLVESYGVEDLQVLDLSHNALPVDEIAPIFESGTLPKLRILNMANNQLRGTAKEDIYGAMPQILESRLFQRLSELDLSGNPLGDDGFWHFFNCTMPDEDNQGWLVSRVPVWEPVYSADGNIQTNFATGRITVPQRLILRDTGMDEHEQKKFREYFGDRVIL